VPTLTVIAGPNGCGKSTLTRSVDFEGRDRLLDPDGIARGLNPLNPPAAAIAAGREVLKRTADYLNGGLSFAVATTLSSHGRVELIRKAKSRGYQVHFVFIGMDSPERCITRIRNRLALGGHSVPDADVRRRYARSVVNAAEALRWVDIAHFYDNSGDSPCLILVANASCVVWQAEPLPEWVGRLNRP
jgi:predicted ABC-type ATPase